MEGQVKWFNETKGFGFIKGDDDVEYFVHNSALSEGVMIQENDRVSFEPAETERGKQAQKVALLQKDSESETKEDVEETEEKATEETEEESKE